MIAYRNRLQYLTPAGWRTFLRIMQAWHVADGIASDLLCISAATLRRARKSLREGREPSPLNMDQTTRVNLLIGIVRSLRILHSRGLADQWMSLPNQNVIFGGRPPMEYAQNEGILGLYTILEMLLARQESHS